MSEENPVIDITTKSEASQKSSQGKGRTFKPSYIDKIPERPDAAIQRRADFEQVTEDAERHRRALDAAKDVTTRADRYVSILFTPQQVAYLRAKIATDRAQVAEDILVKLESAL